MRGPVVICSSVDFYFIVKFYKKIPVTSRARDDYKNRVRALTAGDHHEMDTTDKSKPKAIYRGGKEYRDQV